MAKIRSKDSKPEIFVRRLVHGLGYRYRLHRADLEGKPDLVFGPRKKVIFVHGCFWHGHACALGRIPKTHIEFWKNKIDSNRARDERQLEHLKADGWSSLVIWECQLKYIEEVKQRICDFLGCR